MPSRFTVIVSGTDKLTGFGHDKLCAAIQDYAAEVIKAAGQGHPEITGDMIDDAVTILKLQSGGGRPRRSWKRSVLLNGVRVCAFVTTALIGLFAGLVASQSTAVTGSIGFSLCFAVGLALFILGSWLGNND
jgi:hypothetical protein